MTKNQQQHTPMNSITLSFLWYYMILVNGLNVYMFLDHRNLMLNNISPNMMLLKVHHLSQGPSIMLGYLALSGLLLTRYVVGVVNATNVTVQIRGHRIENEGM